MTLHHGDLRTVLPTMEADRFTACVTDPPYHLTSGKKGGSGKASLNVNSPAGRSRVTTGFMGKAWDGGDVALRPETWAEVLRVLKPGAHLLAFGGARTYHRMACAIEDAGFEIRDCVLWLYGSGFPKSLDVSKAIDKAAGAEREITGTRKADVSMQGGNYADRTTAPNREISLRDTPATDAARTWNGYGTALKPAYEPIIVARKPLAGTVAENCQEHGCGGLNIDGCRIGTDLIAAHGGGVNGSGRKYGGGEGIPAIEAGANPHVGRWPANVIHDGSEEVLAGFPDCQGKVGMTGKTGNTNSVYGHFPQQENRFAGTADSGSAARFFYCAKASKSDRGPGNNHPTVKPLALMQYLVKLVTMPGENRILDPFAGSGTTRLACQAAGIDCDGIELEVEHCEIIRRRLKDAFPLLPQAA